MSNEIVNDFHLPNCSFFTWNLRLLRNFFCEHGIPIPFSILSLSVKPLLVITQSITFQSMTQKKVMKWAKTCIIKMATREEIKIQNHESSFNAKIQHVMSECHFINFFISCFFFSKNNLDVC